MWVLAFKRNAYAEHLEHGGRMRGSRKLGLAEIESKLLFEKPVLVAWILSTLSQLISHSL